MLPLCDDAAPDGGQPKSFDDEAPVPPPLAPPPRLKPPDPLFVLLDPPRPEGPKLLELPNPDDPLCPAPNPLLDPLVEFVPIPFCPFWPRGEAPIVGLSIQESSTAPPPLA